MPDDVVPTVVERVLSSEKQYLHLRHENSGLERILTALRKISEARESKLKKGEETDEIDEFLTECRIKLEQFLFVDSTERTSHEVSFAIWADEIESHFIAQDPIMLSFDSVSENADTRTSRSVRMNTSISSKPGSTMLDILKSNGKYRVKNNEPGGERAIGDGVFFLTSIAWGFAVIAMMITIGFLTADFWNAQKNLAVQVERSSPKPQLLPAITICGDLNFIPPFSYFPGQNFPGLPLLGISSYSRSNRSTNTRDLQISYPNILANFSNSPVEDVIVTADGNQCRNVPQGFDVDRERRSLKSSTGSLGASNGISPSCLQCFRIGLKRREILPIVNKKLSDVFAPTIQVRVFKSRLFGACRTSYLQRDPLVRLTFVSELERYAESLEKRGVLNFNGFNYSIIKTLSASGPLPNARIDFFCNVYFFSGFFYPSVTKPDISYEYNSSYPELWRKTGRGPYYSAFSWDIEAPLVNGPDPEVLRKDTFTMSAIRLFAESTETANRSGIVSPTTSIGLLDSTQTSVYTFKTVNIGGRDEYSVKEISSRIPKLETGVIDSYQLGFDFQTFETEQVSTTVTMSWPEFLTDVFEFVGLFTGICIFTLIVAPAHSFA